MTNELATSGLRTRDLLAHSTVLARHIWSASSVFPAPSPDMFHIVKCPKDGTTLRLPMNSDDLTVACPVCQSRFHYSTTCVTFDGPLPTAPKPPPANRWWSRALARLRP